MILFAAALASAITHASTFSQWEAQCRGGTEMAETCQAAVLTSYSTLIQSSQITCDFHAFWAFVDKDRQQLAPQQWSLAVIYVTMQPQVCWRDDSPPVPSTDLGM
jgi:hypothetical protein